MDEIKLYRMRRDIDDPVWKQSMWKALWEGFFHKYVDEGDVLLDLGAGACEFINAASAAKRFAVDMNPDLRTLVAPGVEPIVASADSIPLGSASIDTIFTSNMLEHLPSPEALVSVLEETRRLLKPGGRLLILVPNIHAVGTAYWDVLDHRLPLTPRSMIEAAELAHLDVLEVRNRFLPYSVRQRLPRRVWLVKLYLRFRPVWLLMGKQMFVVVRRPADEPAA